MPKYRIYASTEGRILIMEFDGERISRVGSAVSHPTGKPFLHDHEVFLPAGGGYEIFSEDLSSSTRVDLSFSPRIVLVYDSTVVAISESSVLGFGVSETIEGIKDSTLGPDGIYIVTNREVFKLSEAGLQKVGDSTATLNTIAVGDSGEVYLGTEEGLMLEGTTVLREPVRSLFYSSGNLYVLTDTHLYVFDTVLKEFQGDGCDVSSLWISDFEVLDGKLFYASENDSIGVLEIDGCRGITSEPLENPIGITVRGE